MVHSLIVKVILPIINPRLCITPLKDRVVSAGEFLYPDLVPPELTFENTISSLEEREKHTFLAFVIGHMLCWEPERRMTAMELLQHPWLAGTVLPWQIGGDP